MLPSQELQRHREQLDSLFHRLGDVRTMQADVAERQRLLADEETQLTAAIMFTRKRMGQLEEAIRAESRPPVAREE